MASKFDTELPQSLTIRSFTLPTGVAFQSRYFGAAGQYQFAVTPGRDSRGQRFRASLRSGWGPFNFTGYAERDTNAPTLSFIYGQVPALQQLLDQQAISATTVQQVDQLLSNSGFLIAAGYLKGATINLAPVRSQIGGTAGWSGRGVRRRQLAYSFLFNDNQALEGSTEDVAHTLTYSQSVTRSDDVSLSCSVVRVHDPGRPQAYTSVGFIGWRHRLKEVPRFIVPERHGTITGNVFRNDHSRRALTGADGSYRFSGVPCGPHRITALYRSPQPFFFTTASDLEVDEDATVNFGIGHSLSGLMGQVLNDTGRGVAGVTVVIHNKASKWSTATEDSTRVISA